METIFDEVKGLYRVYNPDGSYQTYTPAQFKELGLEVEEIEEEETEIGDAPVDTTPTTGDESTPYFDGEGNELQTFLYKTLQPIPRYDEEGNELSPTSIGVTIEVPAELGDSWVEQGLAEKVELEESNIQA